MEDKKYFKTAVGMLAAAFSEAGEIDGNGNPIQPEPNDTGMTEKEYIEWKTAMFEEILGQLVPSNDAG